MNNILGMVLKRFGKAFVAGGVASLVVQLANVPALSTLEQWKTWGLALAVAFISGGLMALEKSLQVAPNTPTE